MNLTADVARISLPVHTIDIDRDRHLHIRYVNRGSGILVGRRERNSQRGHSLIHKQEVGLVFRPRFAVGPVSGETLVAHASELILPSGDAARVRRTDRGVVSARGLGQARETVAVVALKLDKIPFEIFDLKTDVLPSRFIIPLALMNRGKWNAHPETYNSGRICGFDEHTCWQMQTKFAEV